ncbi:MAG TPA: hypothetical protein VHE82_03695 [Gemmatimonadaceae bacterium]|nr:hypothetical protein [Gemmatimonadaceae bacterium]
MPAIASKSTVVDRIVSDVKLGVVCGLLLAAFFCVIALLVYLFKGPQPFAENQTSLVVVLASYLMAGGLGGLVVGLILRLAKWMFGAALVGFVATYIVWFLVGWSIKPQEPLVEILKSSVVLAAAFGLPIGIGLWYQVRRYQRTGKWS